MTPDQLVSLLSLLADLRLQISLQANRIAELEAAAETSSVPKTK